jgi:hypothetical protein
MPPERVLTAERPPVDVIRGSRSAESVKTQ